jgi:hypothetical protein
MTLLENFALPDGERSDRMRASIRAYMSAIELVVFGALIHMLHEVSLCEDSVCFRSIRLLIAYS